MTAFNVVRFCVKEGQEKAFVEAHRKVRMTFRGFMEGWLIKTGDRTFCLVGQWKAFRNIVDARPEMIRMLDETRGMLEDRGGGLGVTDPVSGEVVVTMKMAPAEKRRAKKIAGKTEGKAVAKKTKGGAKKRPVKGKDKAGRMVAKKKS